MAKLLNTSPEHALHDISYVNAMMYSHATPMMGDESPDGDSDFDPSLDACDPANFSNTEEETIV